MVRVGHPSSPVFQMYSHNVYVGAKFYRFIAASLVINTEYCTYTKQLKLRFSSILL